MVIPPKGSHALKGRIDGQGKDLRQTQVDNVEAVRERGAGTRLRCKHGPNRTAGA
jgi:hypothetical protein